MTKPHVFVGPTLSRDQVAGILDARILPPAAAGDILRSTLAGAETIVLIDGLYESVGAVRHKEILFALSKGVRVVGCSSMGALRASELDGFGMEGIGRIYQWYRSGFLEDDDEVAVRHGPAEGGFRPLSEALVNIRAVVHLAEERGVIAPEFGQRLIEQAKILHYADRTWAALRSVGPTIGIPLTFLARLNEMARSGLGNLKASDARQALECVAQSGDRRRVTCSFVLEETLHLRADIERSLEHLATEP